MIHMSPPQLGHCKNWLLINSYMVEWYVHVSAVPTGARRGHQSPLEDEVTGSCSCHVGAANRTQSPGKAAGALNSLNCSLAPAWQIRMGFEDQTLVITLVGQAHHLYLAVLIPLTWHHDIKEPHCYTLVLSLHTLQECLFPKPNVSSKPCLNL